MEVANIPLNFSCYKPYYPLPNIALTAFHSLGTDHIHVWHQFFLKLYADGMV